MYTIEEIKEEYLKFYAFVTRQMPITDTETMEEAKETFDELVDDLTIVITQQLVEQGKVDCSKKLAK